MSTRIAAAWTPLVKFPFLICLVVLGSAAVVAGPLAKRWKQAFIKEPIYCRKPLHELRKDALGPYRFWKESRHPASIVAALGTDMYVSWVLEDIRKKKGSPLRYICLDITYYTGAANLVPHTPDVCMRGAGYQIKEAESTSVHIAGLAPGSTEVPIRILTFVQSQVFDRAEPTVVYTFHTNGQFATSRTKVRATVANPRDKHAYFSKVEVSFAGRPGGHRNPSRARSIKAAREFLEYLLPVLVREHWPDWEEVKASEEVG